MDKNAIKKYAVWARIELMDRVRQKAEQYDITADANPNADSASGKVLTNLEKRQRQAAITRVSQKGYEYVIEEVAYTWFNRFAALRYMEVNNYLPSRVRVFTDEEGKFKPQILTEAINLNLDGLDMEKVYELKEQDRNEELYKYLLITQCNALRAVLPQMFKPVDERCKEERNDYTMLLFPENLLREGSVIEQMITMIPEENWQDAVQIIGWLYQYYNTEQNELVYDGTMQKAKIPKNLLPAATTIYTPDWAVRYMVENSLGRLWLEGHPDEQLQGEFKYYLEEAKQEAKVLEQLERIRKEYADLKPEDIRCIDPCMGSGHILVYMFDVLMKIYTSYGYAVRESVQSIIEHNLYGLDIDDRAAQLAYFAVMMKACQYDQRFLKRDRIPQPHVYAVRESNSMDPYAVEYFCNGNPELTTAVHTLMKELKDASEYGSTLNVTDVDFGRLYARFEEVKADISMHKDTVLNEILPFVEVTEVLAGHYQIIVTNPPYLGFNRFNANLSKYVTDHYTDVKTDLSTVMFKHVLRSMCTANGFVSFITTSSWMYLSSFEKFRQELIADTAFDSIVDYGTELFDGKVGHNQIVSWVTRNSKIDKKLCAVRLVDYCYARRDEKEPEFFKERNRYYTSQQSFSKLPAHPISYWATDKQADRFTMGKRVDTFASPKQGLATADNNRFLRLWYEVSTENCFYHCKSHEQSAASPLKWYPYNKGGGFRKWYGNYEYLINWQQDGAELRAFKGSVLRSPQFYFSECASWCKVTSGDFSMRYIPEGFLFDVAGCSLFENDGKLKYVIGYMNSVCNKKLLSLISPTLNFEVGHIASLPVIFSEENLARVEELVDRNIELSAQDWDAFEVSWDFKQHPLTLNKGTIEENFNRWSQECEERFAQIKANEEELNRIFIDIYELQDELAPQVEDKSITVRKAELQRDIKSLISYAVGCMFGRYSLDEAGLIYAGGTWDAQSYGVFGADEDNIIPICDDEYFEDDIVGLFVKFIEVVYGKETLDANLRFVAKALGGKGTPKEVIRDYFISGFFADHKKMYQNRPIYWLFDSGKKNGFKALMYIHRYQSDMIARMRTDYVHEQQGRYRTAIEELENRITGVATSERVALNKQLTSLKGQAMELHGYEEKIHHVADQYIDLNLDEGVKNNYEVFQDILAKLK